MNNLWEEQFKMRKLLGTLLILILVITSIPFATITTSAASNLSLAQLEAKFPHGAYWNGGDPDRCTDTPCVCHGRNSCGEAPDCTCNGYIYGGMKYAWQCMGFAFKLQQDAYGGDPYHWEKNYNYSNAMSNLKPGDVVRYDNHSIFITYVSGDYIEYADCNATTGGNCQIRWKAHNQTKSSLARTFSHVIHAPYDVTANTAPAPVNVGDDFYAYIINTSRWMHLTNDENNVSLRSETGNANQIWFFDRLNDGSYSIRSALNQNAMEVCNFGTEDGANVQTLSYTGNTAQQWYIYGESGAYVFRAKCAETVLNVANGASDEGTNIQMWTSNGSDSQLFQIWILNDLNANPAPTPVNIGDDFCALILNTAYWKPITNDPDGYVRLRTETGSANQLWHFDRQDDGSYVISSAEDGAALEVSTGNTAYGTPVAAAVPDWGGNYQRWYICQQGAGYVFVSKHYSGLNLTMTLAQNQSADGTSLITQVRDNSSPQIWSIYGTDDVQLTSPSLTVYPGDSTSNTTFCWHEVYGELRYDIKIWNGTYWVGDAYHIKNGVTSGYELQLPAGYYEVYVDAINYYDCKMSNVVAFTVKEGDCTLTYHANGGTNAPNAQQTPKNSTITLSGVAPTKTGYTFLGWSTSDVATTATYSPGDSIKVTSNITLYAVWAPSNILIGDVNNNGEVTSADTVALMRFFLGNTVANYNAANADVNGDKVVTSADIVALMKLITN